MTARSGSTASFRQLPHILKTASGAASPLPRGAVCATDASVDAPSRRLGATSVSTKVRVDPTRRATTPGRKYPSGT